MKAVLCKEYGPPEALVMGEVPSLTAGPGQVVVTVKACGVNFPDVLVIQNKYQFKPPLPFSPGGEVAGFVKQIGPGVTRFRPGDRIVASIGHGGMAEEALATVEKCMPMPDDVDFSTASGFILTYATSHYALKDRASLKPGEISSCSERPAA